MRATFRVRSAAGVAHDEPVLRAAVAQLPLLKHDALRRDAANYRACVADALPWMPRLMVAMLDA